MNNKIVKTARWVVILLTLLVDQCTKIAALYCLLDLHDEHYRVFPGLNFTLTYNYGVSFGFLSKMGLSPYVFIIIAIILSVFILKWTQKMATDSQLAGAMIAGGALGNVIDRFLYGYVIDFIDIYYGPYHYPAFNIADACICIGCIYIAIFAKDKETCRIL